MSKPLAFVMAIVTIGLIPASVGAQPTASTPPTPARIAPKDVLLRQIAGIEKLLTGIATEMPADKYEFVPTEGRSVGSARSRNRSSMPRRSTILWPTRSWESESPATWLMSAGRTTSNPRMTG